LRGFIPVGYGYEDGDKFLLRGWGWDSQTHPPCPVAIPNCIRRIEEIKKT